jgi:hypothetical protein
MPSSEEALEANRAGRLSEQQRRELDAAARQHHGGVVGLAFRRVLPLGKDVQAGRVDAIEGAVTKRMGTDIAYNLTGAVPQSPAPTSYRIWVANRELGNQEFRTSQDIYESAPEAGIVRLFYLPRSRWVVNLERLPDLPVDVSQEGIAQALSDTRAARDARDKVGAAEARAEWAALERGIEAYVPKAGAPPGPAGDPGALRTAIVGTWSSPFLDVTVRADGTLTTRVPGAGEQSGRWSVDAEGRLHLDAMGSTQVVEASVEGEWLALGIQGQSFRLKRSSGG